MDQGDKVRSGRFDFAKHTSKTKMVPNINLFAK